MGYNIGPKIGIDGEREFRDQIRKINDTYKALEAETKAVCKAYDAQGDEQGKLEAQSKQLSRQIEEQQKKQALLEDAIKKATAKFGENSIEATRLRGAYYDTQATISDLESELAGVNKRLDGTGEGMEDLESATKSATDSALSFKDVMGANLIADLTMNALREATSFVKNFASGSLDAAADMVAAEAQFEQTFGALQEQATESLEKISDDTNIAVTRMQGSFTKIYAFAKTAGADSSQALMISSRAMAAASDSAAYYDRSIEDVTESLQAFLKGNYANDAALGISATETSRNTMANQLYAKSFKELTEAQKVDTLLAMVEAGNKASGALGQAARESDSWGNTMGELSEMFRQMQAEAGKPALKALTPAIQRITKAGYELTESINWERFGNILADIVDGAIDYGPEILRILSAVVAGIAAFKLTKMISDGVAAAKAFLGIGKAATSAGKAVLASGKAAAASPWMLVASAISAAIGYISMAGLEAELTESALGKVSRRLQETKDQIEETYRDAMASARGTADTATYYVDRLEELEEAGLDTAESQRQYNDTVAQLKKLLPEMNLEIDESTGKLTQNSTELRTAIDSLYETARIQAQYDKLADTIALQADAYAEASQSSFQYTENIKRLKDYSSDLFNREKALVEIESELSDIQTRLSSGEKLTAKERHALTARTKELTDRQNMLTGSSDKYLITMMMLGVESLSLQGIMLKTRHEAEQLNDEIAAGQLAVDGLTISTQEKTSAEQEHADAVAATTTAVDNLITEYTEAEAAARASIDSQIGLFDKISMKSDWSTAKIMENWKSQQQALTNYNTNLRLANEMGLDPKLVEHLSDGSIESMQILDKLVHSTTSSVDEINAQFQRTDEARDAVASTMATMQIEAKTKWDSIAADAQDSGQDIVNGAIAGIKAKAPSFYSAMYNLGYMGHKYFDKANDRNSPAKEYIASTKDVVVGAVLGVERYKQLYADAMSRMGSLGIDSFLQSKLDLAVSYPDMVSAATNVTNNRTVTHMGGFNIQIYQQPGEDAYDLAYRVMDLIQTEVDSRGAVFHA